MIEILQETTKWDNNISNGIYHVNSQGHLVAYQAPGSKKLQEYIRPLKRFSKSYRKFKKIGERNENEDDFGTKVAGSGGTFYFVKDGTCTCSGFQFRSKCKHLEMV